jgi:excisionase family DNA binding protein
MSARPSSTFDSPLIDRRGVAELLGCSESTVDNLRKRGELPQPVRIGRLVRYDRDAVLAQIRGGGPARPN